MMTAVRAIGCILVVLVACGTNYHVDIPQPPQTLTPAQRVQAFEHYRQRGEAVETTCSSRGGCSSQAIILLNDGSEVRHAEDLLPILSPTSTAGRAAVEVAEAQRRSSRWTQIAWGGFLGGLAMVIAGAKLDSAPAAYTGLGVMVLAPIVGIGGVVVNTMQINDDTKTVFEHYDQGLAERFRVCVNGLAMVACELNVPGAPPPPAEPDPALRSLRQR